MRIISLNPAITELFYELNADNMLVGVSKFCNYPSEVKDKPIVGKPTEPNLDLIEELQPDLIFTIGKEQEKIHKTILQLGIQAFHVQPTTLREVFDSFIQIAEKIGMQAEARALVNQKKGKMASIQSRTKNLERKTVMIDIDVPKWIVEYGVYSGADIFPGRFTQDDLENNEPFIIFTDNPKKWGSYNTHKIDPVLLRPGPRIPDAIHIIGSHVHPSQFATFGSMRADIDEYYRDIELPDPKAQYEV